jgi:hypothetical protein
VLTFDVHSRTDDDCNRNLSAGFFVGHLSILGWFVVLLLVRVYYIYVIVIRQGPSRAKGDKTKRKMTFYVIPVHQVT